MISSNAIVIVITISRCNVIVIDYIVNVIIISDYYHDYTRCLIIYHVISVKYIVWYVRQKLTKELICLLTDCCHIYTHDDMSVYLFYEHESKMCWNSGSDVAAIISHINRRSRLSHVIFTWFKPKLVTHRAIVHDFFLIPSF